MNGEVCPTPEVLEALGGGLAEVAVRLTVSDGDTAQGDFDFGDNVLLLNWPAPSGQRFCEPPLNKGPQTWATLVRR